MKNKLKVVLLIAFSLVMILGNFYTNFQSKKKYNIIMSDYMITTGRIHRIFFDRYGRKIDYVFFYNGKEIKVQEGTNIPLESEKKFMSQSWPVIFSKKEPKFCDILIEKKDFEKYNLQRPDSLINI